MQKEVILAIFVGFIIGLLLTFGIWQANNAIKTSKLGVQTETTEQSEELVSETQKPILSITSPTDSFLSKEVKVSLKGSYSPNSQIAILSEKGQKVVSADDNGLFETEINLITGENLIEIYGFSKEGDEAKQAITVVYTTADIWY